MSDSIPIRILNIFMVLDRGGAETLVMNLYRHIDRSKIQFDFLVHGDKKGAYEDEILALGGRIYRMPNIRLASIWKYNKALKSFFAEHKEYKIVHAHNSELGNLALRQAKLAGIPHRICHAHSAPHGFSVNNLLRNIFKIHADWYTTERFACSEMAGRWQFGNKPFTVLKNGIDTARFCFNEKQRSSIRAKLGIENDFVFGHVGRFVQAKNHEFLLHIFQQVTRIKNNATLLLVGEGPLKPEIEQLSRTLGLHDKVQFLGARDDVPDILNACDAFVFPSLFEGLGIGLIEAQASGLPCFASQNVPSQVAITDLCSFLPLENPEEWAEGICSTHSTDRAVYCQKVIDAGYDISASADLLTNLYLRMQ